MAATRQEWRAIKEAYARSLAAQGIHLALERGAWARTDDGRWVVIGAATDQPKPDAWWLGFDEEKLASRPAAGQILLCRKEDGSLVDFGLPAAFLREIAPQLGLKKHTNHREFTVIRKGDRYELLMLKGRSVDITARRGDVSWLARPRGGSTSAREAGAAYVATPVTAEARFFARCKDGALHPEDAADLEDGAAYLVVAVRVPALPAIGAERRILAAARPVGLPADLSEQHDHYAHGARRP